MSEAREGVNLVDQVKRLYPGLESDDRVDAMLTLAAREPHVVTPEEEKSRL